jgi:hypothetical protein
LHALITGEVYQQWYKLQVGSPILDRLKVKGQMKGSPGFPRWDLGERLITSSQKTIYVEKSNDGCWIHNLEKGLRKC